MPNEYFYKRLIKKQKIDSKSKSKQAVSSTDNPSTKVPKLGKESIQVLSDKNIKKILMNNTCTACHDQEKRLIGLSYKEIAKRGYSNERIVELIYKPEPKNWPEYATPMAPMQQVPREQALQIAQWINSLK